MTKDPAGRDPTRTPSLSDTIWKDMRRSARRKCELASKTIEQLVSASTPCVNDHQFKDEELETVGELPKVCSHFVLHCLYSARIGRPDILWSVHCLTRAITKWIEACGIRLARLISYIHITAGCRQFLSCGKHCITMLNMSFLGRRLCR